MNYTIGDENLPEEFWDVAELSDKILNAACEYDTKTAIRAISSCLSMSVVNTAPSRESAEELIKSLLDTILKIIKQMDEDGLAGWNEERTLQ